MSKISRVLIIIGLILGGSLGLAETAVEIVADNAFYNIASKLDQLNTDVSRALAPSETAHINLFNIFGNKGRQAYFDRLDQNSKIKAAPFLARVASDYFDEVTKKWLTVSGMGTLVTLNVKDAQGVMKPQQALITASHVSQGTRLRVRDVSGRILPLVPGKRLANVDQDVEIVFLQGNVPSGLNFDEKEQAFVTQSYDLTKLWTEKNKPNNYAAFDVSIRNHVAVLVEQIPNLQYAAGGFDFYYLNDARQPIQGKTRKEKARFVWDRFGRLQKPLVGPGLMSSSKMPPGLSGAPLMGDRPPSRLIEAGVYNMRLEGIVLAQHSSERKTFYSDGDVILDLVKKIRAGQSLYTSPTRWRVAGALTYRDYGNGKLEAAFASKPSANFSRMDSGNASSIDSGNASSIDSGNASSIDSGNASSIDSGNASSIDSGKSGAPKSIELLWGSQEGYGKKVVGHILQRKGQTLAVVSTPFVEKDAATLGFTSIETITGATDLYKLAKIKSQYVNRNEPAQYDYHCFYRLDEKGLVIGIYTSQPVPDGYGGQQLDRRLYRSVEMSRADMAKGLLKNSLRYEAQMTIDMTGMFITDFSAITPLAGIEGVLGPSVVITGDATSRRLSCFSDMDQMYYSLGYFGQDVLIKANDNIRSFYK
jgi:hypothetical protein